MIVNDELERMLMKLVVTCVKVEFKHLHGRILRDGWFQG